MSACQPLSLPSTILHPAVPIACRSALRAHSGKGLARRRAEDAWLALHSEHGLPLHAFRLGGAAPGSRLVAAHAALLSEACLCDQEALHALHMLCSGAARALTCTGVLACQKT